MTLTKDAIHNLYQERAGSYDFTANLYYLIGFHEAKYRKMSVSALNLKLGNTVVEIGCGTGRNFQYLLQSINNTGQVIGVDFSEAMLEKARLRIERNGWKNVQLVQSDAASYEFPPNTNGVISTLALTLIPEYEVIIERVSRALMHGGRLVILDLKQPEEWPLWIVKLGVAITKPFGVSLDLAARHPWETMKKNFPSDSVTEIYGGFVYLAVGKK